MSNGTKRRMSKCQMGQNVELYIMSNICRLCVIVSMFVTVVCCCWFIVIIRFYIINLKKTGRMEKMSENIWICPCPHVHVHVSLSVSICPCPHPRPCVPVRVLVPLGHGHGQGHMVVDMGRFLLLNFREFMICVHTVMSDRFFFFKK